MNKRIWKKAVSALTSLVMAAGALPLQSIPGIAERIAMTASAASAYVDVGTVTDSSINTLPMFPSAFGYSEQIYTAEELNGITEIQALSFFVTSSATKSLTGDLYLLDTDKDSFDVYNCDNVALPADAEPVFSGVLPFDRTGEAVLPFSSPYTHDPSKNLLVVLVKTSTPYDVVYFSYYDDNTEYYSLVNFTDEGTEPILPEEGQHATYADPKRNCIRLYSEIEEPSLVLKPNGAPDFETVTQSTNYGEYVTLNADTFTYAGHELTGWNTKADGSGTHYAPNETVHMTENLTLYAEWTSLNNIVQIGEANKKNGYLPFMGLYNYSYSEQIYTAKEIGAVNVITELGFHVETPSSERDWKGSLYLLDTDKKSFASGTDVVSVDGLTPVYTGSLPWNSEGWQMLEFEAPYLHDPAKNLLVVLINETGAWSGNRPDFSTYDTAEYCAAYQYQDDTPLTPSAERSAVLLSVKNTIRLKWVSDGNTYNIFYAPNYPGGETFESTGLSDLPTKILQCTFKRDQHYFICWNTKADGSGTNYVPGETVTRNTDLTLYAQWAEKKTVTFTANGGTGDDYVQYFIPDEAFSLDQPGYTRRGYVFTGWNTKADGSGTHYAPDETVHMTESQTLYAEWLSLDGKIQIGEAKETSGYLPFVGSYNYSYSEQIYTAEEIGAVNVISELGFHVATPSSDRDWRGSLYLLDTDKESFDSETDTVSVDGLTPVYTGSLPWNSEGWQMLEFETPYLHDPAKNLLVVLINETAAYGNKPEFSTFDAAENCAAYQYQDHTPLTPSAGSSANRSSEKNTIRLNLVSDDKTYNIFYAANYSGGATVESIGLSDLPTKILQCTLERDQHYFTGWNTKADGSGTAYAPGDTVTRNTDLILYAQWAEKKTVTFTANGGAGDDDVQYFIPDEAILLDPPGYTRTEYEFINWNTEADGSGTAYFVGQNMTLSDSITLYAQWGSAQNVFHFSTDPEEGGWRFIDYDGDGYCWSRPTENGFKSHSGEGEVVSTPNGSSYKDSSVIASASYINNIGKLTPDNWAVSPAFKAASTNPVLSFWAIGFDPDYAEENFAVYAAKVSDVDLEHLDPTAWTKISGEEDLVSTPDWTPFSVDLSSFAGETVYIAFRHYNITDQYYLNIDDVYLPASTEPLANLEFRHNCTFNNNVSMYFAVPKAALEGYSNLRLCVEKQEYAAGEAAPTLSSRTITKYSETTINNVTYYMFQYSNITATDMGNMMYATLKADKDGQTYTSQADQISIHNYAMNRLEKSTNSAFKQMLVDMLNYGAAAQIYFNKNTENLVNADLSDEQLALATQELPELTSCEESIALSGAAAEFTGKNLSFDNNIVLMYRMAFENGTLPENAKLVLNYHNSKNQPVTIEIPASAFTKSGNAYIAKYSDLAITDFRSVISATIYDGDTAISNTQNYSVETYAFNRLQKSDSEEFKNLICEMMKYGISGETYFS